MAMLADSVEVVIGVDTHKHAHPAAAVSAVAGVSWATDVRDGGGVRAAPRVRGAHPGRRVWAIEGTAGYGAGLPALCRHGEEVVEGRPERAVRRRGASPIRSTPVGPPARSGPRPAGPARAAGPQPRCRCGWPPAVGGPAAAAPNASCMRWWWRPPSSCENGYGPARPASRWPPAAGTGPRRRGCGARHDRSPPYGAWRVGSGS